MSKSKFISGLFFFALFLFFLLPPTDPDLGWHLRCGQLIWHESSLCTPNQFSVLLENYAWPNHYWLYQAILYPFYRLAGLWGLTFFNALLMSSAFLFLYWAIENYRWEKMLAIGLIIRWSWNIFALGIRSQLMGFFFFCLLLWALNESERKPKLILTLPLITLGWANSHGSVIVSLGLLAFLGVRLLLTQPKKRFFLMAGLGSAALTTLINPFGLRIYQDAWRHFAVVRLERLIAEWVPPPSEMRQLIILAGLGLFLYLLLGNRRQNKFLAFFVLPFTLAALKARRQVPLFFSLGFYLFFLSSLTKKITSLWLKQKTLRDNLAILTAMGFLFLGTLGNLHRATAVNASWEDYCQKASTLDFPCAAVEQLKAQPNKGNLFNRYEWGGFLIWQLSEHKVFIDGRMPAWSTPSGKSPYTIYLETLQTQPGWEKTLAEHEIDWILISPGTFMDLKLKPKPEEFGWKEFYRDERAVIYQRQ